MNDRQYAHVSHAEEFYLALNLSSIAFFLREHFHIPRIPTFTKQFQTISHMWILAQTLTTDPIPNPNWP